MLMQRNSMTKTGLRAFSSEGEYLKIEVLTKDYFMHWKLTVRGDHC